MVARQGSFTVLHIWHRCQENWTSHSSADYRCYTCRTFPQVTCCCWFVLQWSEVQHLDHHAERSALPHLRHIVQGIKHPPHFGCSRTPQQTDNVWMRRHSRTVQQNAPPLWQTYKCHGHRLTHPFALRHSMIPRRQQRLTFALVRQVLSAHIADTPREVSGIAFLTVPAHARTSH